ncbi:hypothetical protein EUGRSUZ_L02761 [Eucalyptus grandis]|uniref:Uncharacterized protein n=1 Tax=Eucalyptus grandis TaxID=71139 RepID=A0AAD9T9R0_EUCGR|nr:hypothetical protein EUGRSUZ_L02761 [Eucalyptus grandis]
MIYQKLIDLRDALQRGPPRPLPRLEPVARAYRHQLRNQLLYGLLLLRVRLPQQLLQLPLRYPYLHLHPRCRHRRRRRGIARPALPALLEEILSLLQVRSHRRICAALRRGGQPVLPVVAAPLHRRLVPDAVPHLIVILCLFPSETFDGCCGAKKRSRSWEWRRSGS